MSWFTFGTTKKKETNQSFKSTGLPKNWHNELLTKTVWDFLFSPRSSSFLLRDTNLIKLNIGPLWFKSKLSYKQKMKTLYDFVENTYGTNKKKKGTMMSNTAIALKKAYNAKKIKYGSLVYNITYQQQMNIKHLHDDVEQLFVSIARIYEDFPDTVSQKLFPRKPKGNPDRYEIPVSRPSTFRKPKPPPTKYRSGSVNIPPPRIKRQFDKDGNIIVNNLAKQLNFPDMHEHFRPKGQLMWENTDEPLDPLTPPNLPLEKEEDDWGKGGRKRRKRKSRKRKSNKKKRRRTRRKYKKKTRKRKNKRRRRKSRKRYKK